MKIALTQMDIFWENKEENLKTAVRLTKQAECAGAELILFPEMSFTGFTMHTKQMGEDVTGYRDGYEMTETVERMLELSRCFRPALVFGYIRHDGDGGYYNSLMAVKQGRILTQYDKLHPFTYGMEGKYYTGGDHLAKCRIGGICFGFLICYDLRFPEVFQALSGECEAIAVIANWPGERAEHWRVLLQARAIENQCYLLGVNRKGEGNGLVYLPGSMAFDPYGRRLTQEQEEELLYAEIDRTAVSEYREAFPVKKDRRKALYDTFL